MIRLLKENGEWREEEIEEHSDKMLEVLPNSTKSKKM